MLLRHAKLAALAVVALMALAAAPTRAANVENFRFPVVTILINPCTGEPILFAGEFHVTTSITVDRNGGFHFESHGNASQIRGVGLFSDDTYRGTQANNFVFNSNSGGTFEQTSQFVFSMIAPGPDNNFFVRILFHITVNANGEVTAIVDNFEAECR